MSKNNHSARMAKNKMPKTYTKQEIDELPEFADTEDDEELEDDDDYDDDEEDEEEEPEDEVPDVENMQVASIDDILSADDLGEEKFYVKEWNSVIIIRGLSKGEFDHMRKVSKTKAARGRSQEIVEREIVLAGVVQPTITARDYVLLQEKNAGALVRIMNAITDKSGMTDDSEKKREARFPRKR